ncbi:condensation domain-containing protein [Amycolatopsis sp. GM8]|uniref:condensation domain-containing protein n=1 Tax=Amycolatopsis sp. GM8 TaxID=2896530 RepID=UPI001F3EC895|nr:condensation domain-containing protein [Amycolatopsis sp. GM8]
MTRIPLSWQQESFLGVPDRVGEPEAIPEQFTVPAGVTADEVLARLTRIVAEEPSLRIVSVSLSGVTIADQVPLPVTRCVVSDAEEIADVVARHKETVLPRDGRPLWRVLLIEHGTAVRVFVQFDHLIADRLTLGQFRAELCTGIRPPAGRGGGGYLDWVTTQRTEFSADRRASSAAAEFWRRHLDGTSPHRAPRMPLTYNETDGQRQPGTALLAAYMPIPADKVAQACKSVRATPLSLVLASTAATLARMGGEEDLTLKVLTAGRRPRSAAVYGWLNSVVPLRLRDPGLASFTRALDVTRTAWREVLPRQHTPWEFIWRMCEPGAPSGTGWVAGAGQLIVNMFPDALTGLDPRTYPDKFLPGARRDCADLEVSSFGADGYLMRLICDTAWGAPHEMRSLIDAIRDDFMANVRSILSGGEH